METDMNEMRAAQYDSYGPPEVLCMGFGPPPPSPRRHAGSR